MHIDVLVPSYLLYFLEVEFQASRFEIDLGKVYRIRSQFSYEGMKAYSLPATVEVGGTYGTVRLFYPAQGATTLARYFRSVSITHGYEPPKRRDPDIDFPNFFAAIFTDVLSGYVAAVKDAGKSEAEGIRMFMQKYHITDDMIQMGSIQRLLQRNKVRAEE